MTGVGMTGVGMTGVGMTELLPVASAAQVRQRRWQDRPRQAHRRRAHPDHRADPDRRRRGRHARPGRSPNRRRARDPRGAHFAGTLADDLRLARPGAINVDLVAARDQVGALAWARALVVAHRLTQAATADRIVVLDAGRVVEVGPHAELAAGDGPYAHLWAAWSRARTSEG